MRDCTKPLIAMIRGYCIGGGTGIAVSCDIRIAADDARFAVPAAKLGLGYRFDGIKRLADIVGPSFAAEIFFTARQFSAQEALQMGLVNRVVPAAELESYTLRLRRDDRGERAADHRLGQARADRVRQGSRASAISRCASRWWTPATRARTTRKGRPRSWRSASRSSRAADRRAPRRSAQRSHPADRDSAENHLTEKTHMAIDARRPDLTVGVIGTGAMGRGIVQVAAAGGMRVLMTDSRPGAAQEARDFIGKMLDRAAEKGSMSEGRGGRRGGAHRDRRTVPPT